MKKKNILLLLLIAGIMSCSTTENKVKTIDEKFDLSKVYNDLPPSLGEVNTTDIQVEDLHLYEGEVYQLDRLLTDNILLESVTSKNPVKKVLETDPKYADYVDTPNFLSVNEVITSTGEKYKEVTFLNQYTAYVKLRDLATNKTEELMLNSPQTVHSYDYSLPEDIRYGDLKVNNNRIFRDIVTNEGGYEKDDYNNQTKYKDYDDLAGKIKVKVETDISGIGPHYQTTTVDFGTKLTDFKDDYSKLLSDLSKRTLKFDENGNVLNGFDDYNVKKILDYENAVTNDNPKIEFTTEVLGDTTDKKAGEYEVVRKIIKDGKVIFSKKEKAYVSFPGTTVIVADEAFNPYGELEARSVRYIPLGINKIVKDKSGIGLDRPHGSDVVGSIIDEVAIGNSNYLNALMYLGMELKESLNDVIDNGTSDDDALMENIKATLQRGIVNIPTNNEDVFYEAARKVSAKVNDYADVKNRANNASSVDESKEIMSNYYKELLKEVELMVAIPEVTKLEATDLHFKLISIDSGDGLRSSILSKYLPTILSQDHNAKVMNMSYGSGYTIDEYLKIKNMTEEQIELATEEYNTNPVYKTAIQAWLQELDNDDMHEKDTGSLYIPSMSKYYIAKDTITTADFKKLLDLRLLTLEAVLKNATELLMSNQDILFVVAQGNTINNKSETIPDLTDFDEYGRKVIFKNPNALYNNAFTSIPTYSNYLLKQLAEKNGEKYTYDYSYRKNMIGVVGLAHKALTSGSNATENIDSRYGLTTYDLTSYYKTKEHSMGLLNRYKELKKIVGDYEKDNSKYNYEYIKNIKEQIEALDEATSKNVDPNGRPILFSFTRAGLAKMWVIATEGSYDFNKELTDEELENIPDLSNYPDYLKYRYVATNPFIGGSSFAAPRVSGVAAEIGTKFPWMTAHQIKQVLLTTAKDDFRIIEATDPNTNQKYRKRVGLYGVDKNIGWGILDKRAAYNGPSRFVKALTLENGEESFVANVPGGTVSEFKNDIEGGFDPLLQLLSDKQISELEFSALYYIKDYSDEELLSSDFGKTDEEKNFLANLQKAGLSLDSLVNEYRPAIQEYVDTLEPEYRALFEDAGLVKKGLGTLVLTGDNTYKDLTEIEEGTLILKGSLLSPVIVFKNGKLKLDMAASEAEYALAGIEDYVAKIGAPVYNFGQLYSYSTSDKILSTYIPYQNSLTYIAANASLYINDIDLSETRQFRYRVFRKKGMEVFKKPEFRDEDDPLNKAEEEADSKINYDEKEVLVIEKVKKTELHKLNIGETEYTPYIKLVVKSEDIADDNENVKVIVSLKRNVSSTPSTLGIREQLVEAFKLAKTDEEKTKLLFTIDEHDWMTEEKTKELSGELLATSMLSDYKLNELKNMELLNNVYKDSIDNKFGVFASSINEFEKDKESFNSSNGTLFGMKYSVEHFTVGASFNYIQNKMQNSNNVVLLNNYGIALALQGRYKGFSLTAIPSIDILDKIFEDEKELLYEDRNAQTNVLYGINLEAKYDVFGKDNMFKLEPYIRSNTTILNKGSFDKDESTILAYRSENEFITKSNMTFGTNFGYRPIKNLLLSASVDYTKYLTSTELKNKIYLTEYDFEINSKGVHLRDHGYSVGIGLDYKPINGLNLGLRYNNKNISEHQLNLGVKYEF